MITVFRGRLIHVDWTIYKGTSRVQEDFSRALVKCFLVGPYEKYLLDAVAVGGTLQIEVPAGLPEGVYSLEVIYVKNQDRFTSRKTATPTLMGDERHGQYHYHKRHTDIHFNDRSIMRSRLDNAFSLTEYSNEESQLVLGEGGEAFLKYKSATASYGYDGISAYEIAVMRGDFAGSEGEWLESLRSPVDVKYPTQEEYDRLKLSGKTNPFTFYVITNESKERIEKVYIGSLLFPTNGGTVMPEEPDVYILYGNILDEISSLSEITLSMLESSTNHIIKMKPQKLPKTSLGILPAGCKVVVLIPGGYNYVATKDNGIGGKVPFDESIMGANGESISLGGNSYRMYGEFMTVSGELFIYID